MNTIDKILFTGGTGRLGTEMKKHLDADYIGIDNWDFTHDIPKGYYDLIIHAGAYTNVVKAETEQDKCFQTNVFGTFKMVQTYKNVPFVYISTEYAKNPMGIYALTKQLGEEIVKTHPRHLIIRTLFKPNPWPFDTAYIDQYTQGDYVDIMAEKLTQTIMEWDRKKSDFIYCGTGRKTMFELAQRTKPDVKPNRVKDYVELTGLPIIPTDYA